ncbi:single-stranded DNA-binding protein [Pseudoramibacter sp.]|jgi:single-strand DNA-binding protein|uniref:single-stranded DNA-binding protein n=1 Tax=Pseudoramibacter sp. TaxID=2034862 RepID=UPI0025CC1DB1|nr:single-stranded DNA-binding protein [Pseudoramibacter sp.]MCH4071932.1 single-stranded DNA-binding protein [Pseudoramibacter sp.]MCH4105700.1 single-stranded DNA-binding protein [Pseudoramibacter sp.]
MNKVILVGRLARDPELRTTTTGKSVCSFAIAVDRRFKRDGQPTADFFNVTAWGKQGEVISQYLRKGRQIAISGRLQTRNYVAKDGSKRYTTDIVLEEFDFIGSRNDAVPSDQNTQPNNNSVSLDGSDDIDDDFHLLADDDDVPF